MFVDNDPYTQFSGRYSFGECCQQCSNCMQIMCNFILSFCGYIWNIIFKYAGSLLVTIFMSFLTIMHPMILNHIHTNLKHNTWHVIIMFGIYDTFCSLCFLSTYSRNSYIKNMLFVSLFFIPPSIMLYYEPESLKFKNYAEEFWILFTLEAFFLLNLFFSFVQQKYYINWQRRNAIADDFITKRMSFNWILYIIEFSIPLFITNSPDINFVNSYIYIIGCFITTWITIGTTIYMTHINCIVLAKILATRPAILTPPVTFNNKCWIFYNNIYISQHILPTFAILLLFINHKMEFVSILNTYLYILIITCLFAVINIGLVIRHFMIKFIIVYQGTDIKDDVKSELNNYFPDVLSDIIIDANC